MSQQIVPLWGNGTKGKSANVTAQRRINLYVETFDNPDKTPMALYPRPGLLKGFNDANTSSSNIGTPWRGLFVTASPVLAQTELIYGAQGTREMLTTYAGRFLDSAADFYLTSSGVVQFASNGLQIMSVDGATAYKNGTGSFAVAGITGFPDGARSLCVLASRFIVEDPGTPGRFRWSGVGDITDWNALNFATAESNPDPLIQVTERGGELLLWGNRSLEFWAPTGASDVFARVGGSGIDWGLAIFDTVRKANASVFFLGRNLGGQPQVCRLDGYQVKVVSTPDVDKLLNDALDAGAVVDTSVVTFAGHTWYIVNLADTSIAYDLNNGIWGEWQTTNPTTGQSARWAGKLTSQYKNTAIVTDCRDGRVYYLDDERYLDDTAPIVRELITRHAFIGLQQQTLARLQLDVEVGVGLSTGQGSAPQAMLQISKDRGHTFGVERWRTIGAQGKYRRPIVAWNMLGMSDDWVFRIRIADPVKVVLLNAAVMFS